MPKRIAMIGDSTFRGWGAGDVDYYVNSVVANLPTRMAEALTALGHQTSSESRVGTGNWSSAELVAADPAIDLGGWFFFNTGPGVGGELFAYSGSSMSIDFTGDTLKILACGYPGNSVMRFRVDAGAWIEFDLDIDTDELQVIDVPVSGLGAHTVEIDKTPAGGSSVYHCGILAYSSTDVATVIPVSANGYDAEDYLNTGFPWTSFDGMSAITADIVIFNTGINDVLQGVSQANYESRYSQFIDHLKLINPDAEFYFVVPNDIVGGLGYVPSSVAALAATYGAGVIDSTDASGFEDYSTASGAGLMYDDWHPNAAGYMVLAGHYASQIEGSIAPPQSSSVKMGLSLGLGIGLDS